MSAVISSVDSLFKRNASNLSRSCIHKNRNSKCARPLAHAASSCAVAVHVQFTRSFRFRQVNLSLQSPCRRTVQSHETPTRQNSVRSWPASQNHNPTCKPYLTAPPLVDRQSKLCCRSPISVTIHADTFRQILQRITPYQHLLRSIGPTSATWHSSRRSGLETCCIAVLLANIVFGLSDDRYSAVPPAPATSRARLRDNSSSESLTPMPVALVPGVTAGLPPRFFVHCTRKSTCLGPAVQKKPGPPCSGRSSV